MDSRVDQLREDIVRFNRTMRTKSAGGTRLTATQMQALGQVDRDGPMSARELADAEMVTPQTVARTVASLEQLGMVSRTTDPTDGRASLISITEHGHATLQSDRSNRSEWLTEAIEAHCTDVERDLLFVAGHLLRRLAEDSRAAENSVEATS